MNAPAKGEYRSAVYTNRPPYNEYKAMRKAEEKRMAGEIKGQLSIADMQS